jgi:hypothetical protein
MEAEEKAESFAVKQDERRTRPRFDVDEGAVLLLVSHGLPLGCRVMDLSLEGCRVCTEAQFSASVRVHVEVSFKINGIAFRFSGITQLRKN